MNTACKMKPGRPFVVTLRLRSGLKAKSNHEWPFDKPVLSNVEGLRANGHVALKQSGFTLIEVLVALAILAIAMAAVSRTASSSILHADVMRTHVIADWVAQNRLALHQARGDYPAPGIQTGEEVQAGQTFSWKEEVIATPNPTMRRIVVTVYAPDDTKHMLRELTGYMAQYPR